MSERTNRTPGVVARWRKKRKLRRERTLGMASRIREGRDRNIAAGDRLNPGGGG